jgi:hypothetical protein
MNTYKHTICIDSTNRQLTESSNEFNILLTDKLTNVVSMDIHSVEIPLIRLYSISSLFNNNFFWIILNRISYLIIIPDGNYTLDNMVTILNTLLIDQEIDQVICDADETTNAFTFTLNIEADSFALDFKSPNIIPYTYLLSDSIKNNQTCGNILGFKKHLYGGLLSYTSEMPYDTNPIKYIYLKIEDYNKYRNNSTTTLYRHHAQLIAKIIQPDLNNTHYENKFISLGTRKYDSPYTLSSLKISLIDRYGQLLDFNNLDWSVTLICDIAI